MKKLITGVLLFFTLMSSCNVNPAAADMPAIAETLKESVKDSGQTAENNIEESSVFAKTDSYPVIKKTSFLAAGDNIVYRGNVREALKYAQADGRTYSFMHQYSEVASLVENADISFINQETLMAGEDYSFSYYPRFNSPQDMGHDLVDLGFDIINIANNHMLDWGADALQKTIEFWRSDTPAFIIGDYLNSDEYESVKIYKKRGLRIAFLSYTYGTNMGLGTVNSDIAIPYLEEETVVRQVTAARKSADLVFVSVHWGNENNFLPDSSQVHYAQLMCNLGVDVIIGHHPHVVGPVVWLDGTDGHKMLCAYSLGNFAAEMANDYNMVGGLLTFDIVSENDKKPYITDPLFIPTVYYYNMSFRKNCVYLMRDFTEEMAAGHGIGFYGNYTTLEKLKSYVTDTVSKEFLPDYMN
ncbi:MAG: CapA family protein [Eubacteriales bacterium]